MTDSGPVGFVTVPETCPMCGRPLLFRVYVTWVDGPGGVSAKCDAETDHQCPGRDTMPVAA